MNVTDLRRALAWHAEFPPGRVAHIVDRLKRANIIPNSGRGQSPAVLEMRHVAAALVALAIDGTPDDAANKEPAWFNMSEEPGGSHFGAVLVEILSDVPCRVKEIRVHQSRPGAAIVGDDGGVRVFGAASGPPSGHTRTEFIIPGSVLDSLGGLLRETGGGWGRHG